MSETLYLGVTRKVITPKLGCQLYGYPTRPHAESVHDDIHATVFAFSQGNTKVLMISLELCALRTDVSDSLRQELSGLLDIPKEHILLACTHTHTGPCFAGLYAKWGAFDWENFDEIFHPALLSAAQQAVEAMEPVTVGTAVGQSRVGINRRALTLEDKVTLGENEWGPYNPNMTVLSFRKNSGEILANMISYGAHGTSAGAARFISRDWSGGMIDALEAHSGGITAFFQGTEGDVAPRKILKDRLSCVEQMEALSKVAAADAIRIFDSIPEYRPVTIVAGEGNLQIPLLPRMSYEEACQKCAVEGDPMEMENIASMEYELALKTKKSYEAEEPEAEFETIPQTLFVIGDVVFAGTGFELFSEIGMRIDQAFPEKNIICLSCTNGTSGYFPTRSQMILGGYEIHSFLNRSIQRVVDNADFHFITETIRMIKELEETT